MDLLVDSYPYAGFRKEIVGGGMEFYTYVNIFEAKDLEYLLLMCFFALFIFLLRYLSGPGKKTPVAGEKRSSNAG